MSLAPAHLPSMERVRVRVRGAVQGVGFRPFVFGLAADHGLAGWVLNDGDGVLLEVEGISVGIFLHHLQNNAPSLARIDALEVECLPVTGEDGFVIRASQGGGIATGIPADATVCDDCLEELFDPADRHYLYPFINCTHCGPRYTITRGLPYDRLQTSMSGFTMCPQCAHEYADPTNRRFHAQPAACPACGPRLSLPVSDIVARLKAGGIIAIKGLGGFHIACDARNEAAVAELRRRKDREEKPLAVMVANVASAQSFVHVGALEARHMSSPMRPILVLPKRDGGGLAPSIAPGLGDIGVVLPYTPLHYLLFHEACGRPHGCEWLAQPQDMALVMTSANPGGEPLVTGNAEALRRLTGIADAIVTYDRDIVVRADDSVQRFIGGKPTFIRRARGFVPQPVRLPHPVRSGLAVGAHLKNTVCVARGDELFVSQHIGDLDTPEALVFFEESVDHLLAITGVTPAWVAHDLHPDFYSTRFAQDFASAQNIPAFAVQHHHAHMAAVMAEHGLTEPVLGLALDGFGLGDDGSSVRNWGGEALLVEGAGYRRVGHLAPLPLPGGEAAFRAPWRIAAAVLHQMGREDEIDARFRDQEDIGILKQMLAKGVNVVPSTSCGRLFDAAAGLLGVQPEAGYEGQAPMKLEALVTNPQVLDGAWSISGGVLDMTGVLRLIAGMAPVAGANAFHGTLIAALSEWTRGLAHEAGVKRVVLSGGCLLNRVLNEGLERSLRGMGLDVSLPLTMPPGDGGISLGQAYVAAALAAERK